MRWPYDNFKSQFNTSAGNPFGVKTNYGYHDGDDVNGNGGGNSDIGVPIYAIADGEVVSVHTWATNHGNSKPTFGNHIHIKIDGPWGTRYTHHAHCQVIYKKVGDRVKEGELIARIGNSGTDYAHDHWAIKKEPTGVDGLAATKELLGKWEDPTEFVEKWIGGGNVANNDTIIKKSTQWDKTCAEYKLGDPDHTLFEKLQDFVGGLRSRITDLDRQVAYERTEKENREEQVSRFKEDVLAAEKREKALQDSVNEQYKEVDRLKGVVDGQAKEIGGLRLELAEAQTKGGFEKLISILGLTLYVKKGGEK